ncbi:Zein-binding domain-containing protein [Artemisia annua]|uniref:Zein-binding domain-containing protein n=1 Tax=Artemisia annua TaxID=35608 RepID=A0A2U1KJV2_ARTAN|nr:Zein-binding domain-containing protein [Artemisia annua]
MASSKRSFKKFVAEEMGGFPHFMLWAVLEWILIASLYIDGFIAFISSTFAKIFELEPPCVLCTRVDHMLVGKDPSTYYNESICECHKRDISSLAYCHVHRKVAEIQNMCEGCLLSFATEKESDSNTSKSLLGSRQKENNNGSTDDRKIFLMPVRMVNNHNKSSKNLIDVNKCSCCGEPLKPKVTSKEYARSFSNVRASTLAMTSSPRALTCYTPTAWKTEDSRYTELKFISDYDMPEYDFGLSTDAKKVTEDMKSGTMTQQTDADENDEWCKTPNLLKSNKFFGISLTDSTVDIPRWANKTLRKTSPERSELLTEITNNEASGDGDSSLQQLKKQARMDKKALQLLSMELEEERSASAVAANNAMAMITRLQAEKAAVQMEALQYQRMMEEQAEYDQDAIHILQDVVAKRDEHIRVIESKLESHREKNADIRKVGSEQVEADADEYYQEWKSQSSSSFGEKSEPISPLEKDYVEPESPFETNQDVLESPLGKDFDESGSPMERDFDKSGESHSGRSVEIERETYEEPLLDFETDKHQLYSMLKNLENHIESSTLEDEWDDEDANTDQENRATLKREVSVIRDRLRALEADSGFLKHTAMTLQRGEKGAELLTEIAQHLRKLRHSETSEEDINTTDTIVSPKHDVSV